MVVIFMSHGYETEESTQTDVTLMNATYKLSASFQKTANAQTSSAKSSIFVYHVKIRQVISKNSHNTILDIF